MAARALFAQTLGQRWRVDWCVWPCIFLMGHRAKWLWLATVDRCNMCQAHWFRDKGIKWSRDRWTGGSNPEFVSPNRREEGWRGSGCRENFISRLLLTCLWWRGKVVHFAMEVTWHVCRDIFTSRTDDDVVPLSWYLCLVRKLRMWYVVATLLLRDWWWRGTIVTVSLSRKKGDDVAFCHDILTSRGRWWGGIVVATSLLRENGGTACVCKLLSDCIFDAG